MRTNNKIVKVVKVEYPVVTFMTSSGNYRDLDIQHHLESLGIREGDFGYDVLTNKEVFSQVCVEDNALAWKNLTKDIALPDGDVFTAYFHLDPIECLRNSTVNEKNIMYK